MLNPFNTVASLGRLPEQLADDLHAIRETVEPQQERVAHIEDMVEEMSGRLATLEATLARLLVVADKAIELLPDPEDEQGPLAKARDIIGG